MAADVAKKKPRKKPRLKIVPKSAAAKVRVRKAKESLWDEEFKSPEVFSPAFNIRTVPAMVAYLKENKHVKLDARVLGFDKEGPLKLARISKEKFFEAIAYNGERRGLLKRFRESDYFSTDAGLGIPGAVGSDFIPMIGGPFNKQQYYQDYIKAHMTAFYSYHHDPTARFLVNTMVEFTLGRGFRVDAKGKDAKAAQLLWDMFVKINDLVEQYNLAAKECSIYGEFMWWKLPARRVKVAQGDRPGELPAQGIIPRVRLIDPSCIWDIITFPEDITRKIAYQWVAPTQYQVYTKDDKTGQSQPSLKFIYQQIPADQVAHYRVNHVSNEKRGRSDLYPVLGYLKRLRDSVNYAVIQMQKQSAWAIDTTIDGSQDDIDAYADAQASVGTIPPAGSEFVHSKAVEREYLSSNSNAAGSDVAFEWTLSMIAMGFGLPVAYLGTHITGGSTKASAMVATEPVVKKFEIRRGVYERSLKDQFDWLMEENDLEATCEVTFPELVVQDRSAKITDLQVAESAGWFSKERTATIASKEFDATDYNYRTEQEKIKAEKAMNPQDENPLTAPGAVDKDAEADDAAADPEGTDGKSGGDKLAKRSGISQDERRRVRQNRG